MANREIIKSSKKSKIKSCGHTRTTHSMYGCSEYRTWAYIIQRCNNPNNKVYHYYGGRGIKVCAAWLKFENFFEDMGSRPKGLTIERINNDKGYYKENCAWRTQTEQLRNQRLRKDNITGMRGVCWAKRRKKYLVRITVNGKTINLGYFPTLEAAKTARLEAEQKYWGPDVH
jgi:hypothetical protein